MFQTTNQLKMGCIEGTQLSAHSSGQHVAMVPNRLHQRVPRMDTVVRCGSVWKSTFYALSLLTISDQLSPKAAIQRAMDWSWLIPWPPGHWNDPHGPNVFLWATSWQLVTKTLSLKPIQCLSDITYSFMLHILIWTVWICFHYLK